MARFRPSYLLEFIEEGVRLVHASGEKPSAARVMSGALARIVLA